MRIDAGANGRAAEPKFAQRIAGMANVVNGLADGDAVGGKLLAQADRHRVLHVRAARLHYVMKFFAFGFEGGSQRVERRDRVFPVPAA